jgi:hypothetical protein
MPLLSLILCSVLPISPQAEDPAKPDTNAEIAAEVLELEAAALRAREKLKSGRFDIHVKVSGKNVPGVPDGHEEERRHSVVFRGTSLRWTQHEPYGARTVVMYHEGTYSRRTISSDPAEESSPQVQYGLTERPDGMIISPRLFGLAGGSIYETQHLILEKKALLGVYKRLSANVTTEQVDGRTLKHIKSAREPKGGVERAAHVWLDPERDFCPVKIQFDEENRGASYQEVTTIQLKEFRGIWFPEKMTSVISQSSIGASQSCETTFSGIELNIDIDDSEFSLAKLEPKVGDLIIETPPQDPRVTRVWDGQKPVSRLPDLAVGRPDVPSSLSWRPWVIAGSSLLGVVFTHSGCGSVGEDWCNRSRQQHRDAGPL